MRKAHKYADFTMLPQIDAHTVSSNPHFARLHKDLSTRKLNKDGSSSRTDARELKARKDFTDVSRHAISRSEIDADALV